MCVCVCVFACKRERIRGGERARQREYKREKIRERRYQAPHDAKPLKNLAMAMKSSPSEQLKTTHCIANAFARSFVVSVLPVPAGPAGAPPKIICRAPMSVK